ncbi:MAG TPA: methyltransferase domain-containing protein [Gemmatimonadaceae bacterium]|nr:methyltransferase domain-containing protein [Gemmatimonadaceae bacterium]
MSCCDHSCFDTQFDAEHAAADLKRYRRKGPDRTTGIMIAALRSAGVADATVLDIGGGVGVVHHELIAAGARSATHVDAAEPYVTAAREESERRGYAGRVTFLRGDFVALTDVTPDADVVTLDRVICCYPDMERLVTASAQKARRLFGAVYPRDRWINRVYVKLDNYWRRRRGSAFRTYIHAPAAIERLLRDAGLRPATIRDTILWRVAVFAR